MRKPIIERFKDKVKIADTGCHEWTGRLSEKGYGVFKGEKRRTWQAHRWIYQHINGSIPSGMNILHKCDNRRCVNPNHLYIGTQGDNMKDMYARGRANQAKGERHTKAIFSEEQIKRIKGLAAIGLQPKLLAKVFNSHNTTIWGIIKGKSWSHVPAPLVIGQRTKKAVKPGRFNRAVNMLSKDGLFIRRFSCITDAAAFINRDATGFREVIKKRQPTWGGYKWEYAREKERKSIRSYDLH